MFKTTQGDFTILIDDKIYPEHQQLIDLASSENNHHPANAEHIDYYLTLLYKGAPTVLWHAINGGTFLPNVYYIGSTFGVVENRGSMSLAKECMRIGIDEVFANPNSFMKCKLAIAGWNSGSLISAPIELFKRWGWIYDNNYYCVTQPKNLQRSWKKIMYKGDISLLKCDRVSEREYNNIWGNTYYSKRISSEVSLACKSAHDKRCLIVGDLEGQVAIKFVNTHYKSNQFSIDVITPYTTKHSPVLLKKKAKLLRNNLTSCYNHGRINRVDEGTGLYDIIYNDESTNDYREFLTPGGVYINEY